MDKSNPVLPELTPKRISVLLSVALLLILLFLFVKPNRGGKRGIVDTYPKEEYLTISPYDSLFRVYADTLFDWKMIAAIAYVESRFDANSISYRGAKGLMQLMPATFREIVGEEEYNDSLCYDVERNIEASVKYLKRLDELFGFIDMPERLNYILGSYNGGSNHIFDAMRIARSKGVNRYRWSSLVDVLSKLDEEEYYTDSLCRFGGFDATETILYVDRVQDLYKQYKSRELLFKVANRLMENQK